MTTDARHQHIFNTDMMQELKGTDRKDIKGPFSHRVGSNRKRYKQSMNTDKKSIETVFLIVICRQMAIENSVSIKFFIYVRQYFDVFHCRLPGVILENTELNPIMGKGIDLH